MRNFYLKIINALSGKHLNDNRDLKPIEQTIKLENTFNIPMIKKIKVESIFNYDNDWITINQNSDYKKEIFKCIHYSNLEAYFYNLYRIIIKHDFEDLNIKTPSLKELKNIFCEIGSKILKDKFSVNICNIDRELSINWKIHHANYSNVELEYYKMTILNYINYNTYLHSIIGLSENSNPYKDKNSLKFLQEVALISFTIAYNRINDEIENINYFGCEKIPYNNTDILNIYLTPNGMVNKLEILKLENSDIISKYYSFIKTLGFDKINDMDLKKNNDAKILIGNNKTLYKFVKWPLSLNDNAFINEIHNRPHISSVLVTSQTSYIRI